MLGTNPLARDQRQACQQLRLMVSLEKPACSSDQQSYRIPASRRIDDEVGGFIAVVCNAAVALTLLELAEAMGR
jgi:hypothetical protein